MDNKTCPTCKSIFKYPSRLKIHLQNTIHCKKTKAEIDTYFSNIKNQSSIISLSYNLLENNSLEANNDNNNNIENNKCSKCNTYFKYMQNLHRHLKVSKCSRQKETEERNKQIEILQTQIIELKNQQTIKPNKTKQKNQQIQIINNNHNERIINNNLIINNNNTIIQHIYPLGYEKIPNISQTEMIRLLELGDKGVIEIVKLVCEQDENKNFYKINLNKNNISYLSNQYKIDICQEAELKKTLLKHCVILTYQMLIVCSPLLSSEKIYEINSNLQNMSDKMKEEIYENGLKNIIEYELRKNNKINKDKITKYTKEINNNNNIKEEALEHYNKILQLKDNTNKSLSTGISLFEINKKFGDPLKKPEMEFEYTYNDFNTKRFEYTTYLKYWNKRINDEEDYINTHPNKSLCDFVKLELRKKDINVKLDFMKKQSENMRKCDNQNNLLINRDNFKVLIAHSYINENQRIKF